jgi:putative acetyltransferase
MGIPEKNAIADVIIRAAKLSDAVQLTALVNMPLFRSGTLRPPFQSETETERHLASLGQDISIVAIFAERVVGNAGLRIGNGRRSHAGSIGMGVADDMHGCGIGTKLLSALTDAADNWLNIRRLELTVYPDNDAAIRLYRKFGFENEGVLRAYAFRNGDYADVLTMARLK